MKYILFLYIIIEIIMNSWNNYDFVLKSVKKNGLDLKYASDDLKDDFSIVMTAVKQNGNALKNASTYFRKDPEIVLTAVMNKGKAILYADKSFFKNYKIVLNVVKTYGDFLYIISEDSSNKLIFNYEIFLEAVKDTGLVLSLASDDFKNDIKIVSEAFKSDHESLEYAGEEILNDYDSLVEILLIDCRSIIYFTNKFNKNRKLISNVKNSRKKITYFDTDNVYYKKIIKNKNIDFKFNYNKKIDNFIDIIKFF